MRSTDCLILLEWISRIMRWAGLIACTGKKIIAYKIVVGKLKDH
jgi:ribosomal protein S7